MNRKILAATLLLMLPFTCEQQAQQIQPKQPRNTIPELPLKIPPDSVRYLRDLIDPQLQKTLQSEIYNNARWKRLVEQKKMAVGVVDLSDPYQVKYARLNGNVMMYAASLPKIAILLATMEAIESGDIEDSAEIQALMRQMISKSSNTAATELMDMVGFDRIEQVLKSPEYELYDEDYGGGLWVGKRYAKTGERRPDPLRGISHGATVSQVCRFYYLMAYGKLVSPERSKEMLAYMDNPALNHKFVSTLRTIAPQAHLYRKSGTWKTFHSDSVLVWGPERRYILVALIDDPEGEKILRNMVVVVDNMLKSQ